MHFRLPYRWLGWPHTVPTTSARDLTSVWPPEYQHNLGMQTFFTCWNHFLPIYEAAGSIAHRRASRQNQQPTFSCFVSLVWSLWRRFILRTDGFYLLMHSAVFFMFTAMPFQSINHHHRMHTLLQIFWGFKLLRYTFWMICSQNESAPLYDAAHVILFRRLIFWKLFVHRTPIFDEQNSFVFFFRGFIT